MEKVKTGIIFALSLTVAYGCGIATGMGVWMKALDRTGTRRPREYRSYRDY